MQEARIRIAVASQDFRSVTGHAGRSRRFLVFEAQRGAAPREIDRLELPKELALREFSGSGPHPLDAVDVVIVGSAKPGFVGRMAARGVTTVTTSESDPVSAVRMYLDGTLPPETAHDPERHAGEAEQASEFLKALANETRLMILRALSQGERSVSELERTLGLRQSRVSQQLARLRRAGIVQSRHGGANTYYRLDSRQVRTIIGAVYEVFCERHEKTEETD